jgi:peroxiredoxin
MKDATKKLKESGIEKKAVNLGMSVPNFKLDGKAISSFYGKGNIVLKFYRGGWCPYCMTELKDYQSLLSQFKNSGCEVIAITPDLKKEIKKTKKKHGVGFEIYRDADNAIAKKFGLAFQLDKRLLPIYKKYGVDLEVYQGNKSNELPMPGTYLVDKKGKIRYAFLDADYTKRAPAKEVLKECRKL